MSDLKSDMTRKPDTLDICRSVPLGEPYGGLIHDAADEIERLRANVDRLTSNPADHRYWEGRYRDEAHANETLRQALREMCDAYDSTSDSAPTRIDAWMNAKKLLADKAC